MKLRLLMLVVVIAILTPRVSSGRAQDATPVVEPSASPVASPAADTTEAGPVFAVNQFRISIVAAVRAPAINAVGLRRSEGKDWLVIVADVSNMTSGAATLGQSKFTLRFNEDEKGQFVPRSTTAVARRLSAEPASTDEPVVIAAGHANRVVWAYRIAESAEEPRFGRGSQTVSLENTLALRTDLRNLPPTVGLPSLEESQVDLALDGSSLSVYLRSSDRNVTVALLGVDAPLDGECLGDEAANHLEDLAGDTVLLETPPMSVGGVDADDLELIQSYVWIEHDGDFVSLNQAMIADGYAALGDLEGDERYADWFEASQAVAKDAPVGLWATCTGPHGDALPTPTPLPPTPTPTPEPSPTPEPPTGTRENPVPLGKTRTFSNGFSVKVVDVVPDATDLVLGENQFNDPPAEGNRFFIATIQLRYKGSGSVTTGYGSDFKAVGKSGVAYDYSNDCGVVPNQFANTELFEGGSIEANACWEIRSEDAKSLVMFIGDGSDRVYFALTKKED